MNTGHMKSELGVICPLMVRNRFFLVPVEYNGDRVISYYRVLDHHRVCSYSWDDPCCWAIPRRLGLRQ